MFSKKIINASSNLKRDLYLNINFYSKECLDIGMERVYQAKNIVIPLSIDNIVDTAGTELVHSFARKSANEVAKVVSSDINTNHFTASLAFHDRIITYETRIHTWDTTLTHPK